MNLQLTAKGVENVRNGSLSQFRLSNSVNSNVLPILKNSFKLQTPMFIAILLLYCIVPVQAVPDANALVPFVSLRTEQFQYPNEGPRIALGATIGMLYILANHIVGKFGGLLALSMGVTSVVWVVAKNSPEVQPKFTWV